jgi:signal transduction histidine kinase
LSQAGALLGQSEAVVASVRPGGKRRSTPAEVYVRQWLARELHDSVAQTLTSMVIELERFKTEQTGRRSVLDEVDRLQASTREVLANLRQAMATLRGEPAYSPELGEWMTELLARFQAETGIQTRLVGAASWPSALSTHAAINVSRILEEALHNVRRYSGASRVLVSLSRVDGVVRMRIRDNGRGRVVSLEGAGWAGMGTLGMKERATLLGGELHVVSRFGQGTLIEATLPARNLS